MSKPVVSPAEFVRSYKGDPDARPSHRLADFLLGAAKACPKRFFDKRTLAKVAFNLGRLPAEDSDYIKRLSSVLSTANNVLHADRRGIVTDPVDGARSTVDDRDLLETVHRKKRRRVGSAVESLAKTDSVIVMGNIPPQLRDELGRSRDAIKKLASGVSALPALPPAPKAQKA
jgi:hypothetical protein